MTTNKSARRKGLYDYPKRIMPLLARWYYGADIPGVDKALYTTFGSGSMGDTEGFEVHKGDVCPVGDWVSVKPWILSVELKHRLEWTWSGFIRDPSTSKLAEYWYQCISDASTNRYPLLIFTKNYEKDYCMFLRRVKGILLPVIGPSVNTIINDSEVGITLLTNFLQQSRSDVIIRHYDK
jgi:hypothetical protein